MSLADTNTQLGTTARQGVRSLFQLVHQLNEVVLISVFSDRGQGLMERYTSRSYSPAADQCQIEAVVQCEMGTMWIDVLVRVSCHTGEYRNFGPDETTICRGAST